MEKSKQKKCPQQLRCRHFKNKIVETNAEISNFFEQDLKLFETL